MASSSIHRKLSQTLDLLTPLLRQCLTAWPLVHEPRDQLRQLLETLEGTPAPKDAESNPHQGWARRMQQALEPIVHKTQTQEVSLLAAEGLRICAELRNIIDTGEAPRSSPRGKTKKPRTQPQKADQAPAAAPRPVDGTPTPGSSPRVLKGCGPKTAEKLAARGLETLGDLVFLTPTAYEDRRHKTPLGALEPEGLATVEATVEKITWVGPPWRRRMQVRIQDRSGALNLVWFRVPRGYASRFEAGTTVQASGRISAYKGALQMAHPEIDPPDSEPSIVARYPQIEGISARALRSFCAQAVELVAQLLDDGIPKQVLDPLDLPSLPEAVQQVHHPPVDTSPTDTNLLQQGHHPAQRRLVFGELFTMQLELAQGRLRWQTLSAPECRSPRGPLSQLEEVFEFRLTQAQKRVLKEMNRDLESGRPMQRLLQGDVGSGKTAVAFAAALQVLEAGHGVALMAPTEILAQQHAQTFRRWCVSLGISVVELTGSTKAPARRTAQALISGGDPLFIVGTHALLSEPMVYGSLGMVIIDEQHRFGVEQRRLLREKGRLAGQAPHLLVMTATPIPRSLALTLFGDLDLSVLDEMPPGRRPAATKLYHYKEREAALQDLEDLLSKGLSAYVVCPLVAESDKLVVADAERTTQRLAKRLPDYSVGMIHGKLSSEAKRRALERFRSGEDQVLVATTVIEVGVDVPSAAVMMVINAERFGLAQLHQLRGRVGRSASTPAHCLLMAGRRVGENSLRRLEVLTETYDGFQVAEEDLKKRGPGELSGLCQSGLGEWPVALLKGDTKLLSTAREAANELLRMDPNLQMKNHRTLAKILDLRRKRFFGAEAG